MRCLTFAPIFASFSLYYLWKTCTSVQAAPGLPDSDSPWQNRFKLRVSIATRGRYISLFIRSCQEKNVPGVGLLPSQGSPIVRIT